MTLEVIFVINNEFLLGIVYLEVNRCFYDIRVMLLDVKIKGR